MLAAVDASPPPFAFSAAPLTQAQRHRVYGSSWRPGCPVPLSELRYARVSYVDCDGTARRGELVVNADAVGAIRTAFAYLYAKRFPIRRMHLVDDYGASRPRVDRGRQHLRLQLPPATGATRWSQHAYGRAIDVNTIENPYVYANGTTTHRGRGPTWTVRHRKGMAYAAACSFARSRGPAGAGAARGRARPTTSTSRANGT